MLFVDPEDGDQEYPYVGFPPLGVMVAEPAQAALQVLFTWVVVPVSTAAWVIVKTVEMEHPLASVTRQLYVPAARLAAVVAVPPLGVQA
jgi:hypothetical protein